MENHEVFFTLTHPRNIDMFIILWSSGYFCGYMCLSVSGKIVNIKLSTPETEKLCYSYQILQVGNNIANEFPFYQIWCAGEDHIRFNIYYKMLLL